MATIHPGQGRLKNSLPENRRQNRAEPMTRVEHEIRRRILRNIRARLRETGDTAQKAYLLGLEAGELMKGGGHAKRTLQELRDNFERARQIGVSIEPR
jgi:hypothetical protein